jgi:hypothetical protein
MHGRETASNVGAASTMTGGTHKGLEVVRRGGGTAVRWQRRLKRKCGETLGEDVAMVID